MNEIKKLGGVMEFKGFDILSQNTPNILKIEDKEQVCPKHGKVVCCTTFFDDGTEDWFCPLCNEEKLALEKKAEEERQAVEEQRKKQLTYATYKEHNIEPKYYNMTFDDYIPKTFAQRKLKEAVMQMVQKKKGKIVALGGNGVGKSMLANIAAMLLDGVVYTLYEISTMIRQSYSSLAKRSELEIVNDLASVPFLAIDELDKTNGSKSVQDWLSYILDKRDVRGLPFYLAGNGHFLDECKDKGCPKCLENILNNDILSRLSQDSVFIKIKAPDERKLNNKSNFFEDK